MSHIILAHDLPAKRSLLAALRDAYEIAHPPTYTYRDWQGEPVRVVDDDGEVIWERGVRYG